MPITTFSNAISAYNNAARSFSSSESQDSGPVANPGGLSFSSLLKEGADNAIAAGKKSEELGKQAIQGKADVRDVVAAVNNAELTLQTVVAVRDKVIGAYNDILKMPI
jgi:flagellar hook-basal body complex protein FliE